jgi:hypothetical protein
MEDKINLLNKLLNNIDEIQNEIEEFDSELGKKSIALLDDVWINLANILKTLK